MKYLSQCLIVLVLGSMASQLASAQCPAVGADTACGVVITILQAGNSACSTSSCVSISNNQGPFDEIEDTLIGVINNSNLPIASLVLTSGVNGTDIFGFDGDGICGISPNTGLTYVPAPAGCPFGPTGYEGPGVSFSNISADLTTGTVNFNPPIRANGGTAYFSLEDSLTAVTACSSVINNSVTHSLVNGGKGITAAFTPNSSYTLAQAATLCGFTGWDWQQLVTSLPSPNPFLAAGSTTPLKAPPPFNDPPPNGYAYQVPPNAVQLPVYWNLFTTGPLSLTANETLPYTLNFGDAPADNCLPGGSGASCGGKTATSGAIAFTTHLVGLVGSGPGYGIQDTGVGFSWISTFNGTSGRISVLNSTTPVDPGSGTGTATVTNVSNTASYQYPKGVGISAINGTTISTTNITPPSLLGAGQVAITSSGLAYSRVTQTFNGAVTVANVSNATITGPFEVVLDSLTTGVTLTNATSTFGGWGFVTVTSVGSLPPNMSAAANLVFINPANAKVAFSPVPYSGSFN